MGEELEEEDLLPLTEFIKVQYDTVTSDLTEIKDSVSKLNSSLPDGDLEKWAKRHDELYTEELTDNDILELSNILESFEDNDSSDIDSDSCSTNLVKHGDAVKSFSICIQWAEQNKKPLHEVLLLHKLKQDAEKIDEELEVAEYPDDSEIVRLVMEQEQTEDFTILNESDEEIEPETNVVGDSFSTVQKALDGSIHTSSILVYAYDKIWTELPTLAQNWKRVMLPTRCVFSKGASQKIVSLIPKQKRLLVESPIIYLKAKKNPVEIENMKIAHVKDAAAMCMFFSYFQSKVDDGYVWTELEMAEQLNEFRYEQINSLGNSFTTIVGYGSNGAKPHYEPTPSTNAVVKDDSTIVIDSGGQYYEGTTDVTRTIHLGTPKPEEINAYTRVLMGLIQFSSLTFPSDMAGSVADVMARAPLWDAGLDYFHGTSHGIGSFSSVHEPPIAIHYARSGESSITLEPGYFLSIEPGFYSESYFGVRLENIVEVVNKPWLKHMSGQNFLGFVDVALVPFEPKLINRTLLSSYHIRWLNDYNSKIREYVGKELKNQGEVEAFYWMMKRTEHIPGSGNHLTPCRIFLILGGVLVQILTNAR
ncbi:xaa-pro aminopeptidase 1 [Holotrichia oblita]|uniref:Xaa-pro aminopeptidase 1 n=1 Tax=Holotrichia oblita TaxID=644536 RepID=A0ACB9T0L3_HOLOL|nr:xaa-pro aminopeptidase 1 [Holotrichia oblita]